MNRRDKLVKVCPDKYIQRILSASEKQSLRRNLSLCRKLSKQSLWREILSNMFLLCVPTYRCCGLTHVLLSHLWHTTSDLSKYRLLSKNIATRCVLKDDFSSQKDPYPRGHFAPCHSQQSSGPRLSTLLQNRSMVALSKPMNFTFIGLIHTSLAAGVFILTGFSEGIKHNEKSDVW